eukprot:11462473-Alexandrium_andersonii.AAC.1
MHINRAPPWRRRNAPACDVTKTQGSGSGKEDGCAHRNHTTGKLGGGPGLAPRNAHTSHSRGCSRSRPDATKAKERLDQATNLGTREKASGLQSRPKKGQKS